jgi:hypothetical protein
MFKPRASTLCCSTLRTAYSFAFGFDAVARLADCGQVRVVVGAVLGAGGDVVDFGGWRTAEVAAVPVASEDA